MITDTHRAAAQRSLRTLALASLGLFMVALDTFVVTTALPVLRVDLGASLSDLEWTVNAYNLSFACLLLTGAALGDRFGRRRMFTLGLVLFTAASAAAALSPSVTALIAARAVQGAGAAVVMPLTLTLISEAFPAEKRGMAVGLWGGIAGLAVAAGPVVGGAVIDGIDWHWIFWLNVPIGLLVIPLAARRLSESYGPRPQLDLVGLVLAGAGLLGLTWGLVRSTTVGWGSAEVIAALAAGVILVGAFLAWERRAPSPMLPLALFRRRGFSVANAVSFFMFFGMVGALFLMPQFFQTALGNSPLDAGIRMLPWTATPMVIAPIAGGLADRYGNRPFMAIGMALQAIGLGWVALDRQTWHGLPRVGSGAHGRGRRHLDVLPDRGQRRRRLGAAGRGRRRLGNQQHAARVGERLRGGRARGRVHPPGRLHVAACLHRSIPAGTVGRRRLLRRRRRGGAARPTPSPARPACSRYGHPAVALPAGDTAMNQTPRHRAVEDRSNRTDARWLTEWIEFGLRELDAYMEKHRRFDDFYARSRSPSGSPGAGDLTCGRPRCCLRT